MNISQETLDAASILLKELIRTAASEARDVRQVAEFRRFLAMHADESFRPEPSYFNGVVLGKVIELRLMERSFALILTDERQLRYRATFGLKGGRVVISALESECTICLGDGLVEVTQVCPLCAGQGWGIQV